MLMGPNDLSPKGRNHFVPGRYFDPNVRNGIVRGPTGARFVTLNEDFIQGLHKALEEETGAAAPIVLYTVGKWWGERFVRQHESDIRHFYENDIGELPLAFWALVLRRAWGLFGWGQIELAFSLQDRGFVEVVASGLPYSDTVGNIQRTSDHLVAGALASIFRDVAGRDLEAVEVSCRSKGDGDCRFLIGLKSRISIIDAWVKNGRGRDDIVRSIEAGELA